MLNMHYREFAKTLLLGTQLEDKLIHPENLIFDKDTYGFEVPHSPGRSGKLIFDNQQVKFPKRPSFHLEEKRSLALHFFANHELLAIEMMACALLIYPTLTDSDILFKKGLVKTITDEQKHLKLYLNRMKDFGAVLGDFPLNDFFWKQMCELKNPTKFYSTMALTFESANLDFAIYYEDCFKGVEDFKSAQIMKIVYEDEISHVALGVHWLNIWREGTPLWEYYKNNLPNLMTPARAKGINYNKDSRLRSGLDHEFVETLATYRDDFGITNRKNK